MAKSKYPKTVYHKAGIEILDHGTGGHARFAAYLDGSKAVGLGPTREDAKTDLLNKVYSK